MAGSRCSNQIPETSIEVANDGDSLSLTCDASTECVNNCKWKMPTGDLCEFDTSDNIITGNYIPGCNGIKYTGVATQAPNTLQSCSIQVVNTYAAQHKGLWVCTSGILSGGRYSDNVNVTFAPDIGGTFRQNHNLFGYTNCFKFSFRH